MSPVFSSLICRGLNHMDRDHTVSGMENHGSHLLKCLSMDSLLLGPNLRPLMWPLQCPAASVLSNLTSHPASPPRVQPGRHFLSLPQVFQDLPEASVSVWKAPPSSLVNPYSSFRYLLKCHFLEDISLDLHPSSLFSTLVARM